MYNFTTQRNMLDVTIELLKEKDLLDVSSLGGGTALAAYYWNHRYSTDIDIFIYSHKNNTNLLTPSKWSDNIKSKMQNIGYNGIFKHNNIYSEITLADDAKIQFFDVVKKSINPYNKTFLWDKELNIDSIEEIIAKKIHYRGDIGNTRDLFDIAVAFHKEPLILQKTLLKQDKINELYKTILNIYTSQELSTLYLHEINQMSPNIEYQTLAKNTIIYLKTILENICGAYALGYKLSDNEYVIIEKEAFDNF